MNRWLCLLACLLCTRPSLAQSLYSECYYVHYTSRQGLPGTELMASFEDSRGYIWAICDRGAARFDGYTFTTYTTRHGLPTNNVLLINEDPLGRIWFMCSNGEYCYLQGDTILTYGGNAGIKKLLRDKLPGPFFFDDDGTLWITSFSGIQLFECVGDSVREFTPGNNYELSDPTYYLRRVGDKLLALKMGEPGASNRLTINDNISYLLSLAGDCKLACSALVGENRWMVAGPGGYVVFDEGGNIKANFEPSPYLFSSMERDRSGNIWICNSNGAYRLDSWEQDPNTAELFFRGHYITSVIEDRQGNHWFTDRNNGLYMVPSLHVRTVAVGQASVQNKIRSVKERKGSILFADARGQVYHFEKGLAKPLFEKIPASAVALDFEQLADGTFISGNKPEKFNLRNGTSMPLGLNGTLRRADVLANGTAALAMTDGVVFISPSGKISDLTSTGFRERCNTVFAGNDGTLWIGANSGLFSFDGKSVTNHVQKDSLLGARIMDIQQLNPHTVALATRNRGVLLYTPGSAVMAIDESHGLLTNLTDCIAVQNEQTIWVGTGQGITRIHLHADGSYRFFQIDHQKGLPGNEVYDLLITHDTLYAATNNGLCFFPVAALQPNVTPLPTTIRHFRVNEEYRTVPHTERLRWNENNIRVDYAALNYRTQGHTLYRYRLAGLYNDWVETEERFVQFIQLPAGEYRFEVSARNEDGLWNAEPETIAIIIAPHFTRTWWFAALSGLVLVAAAIMLTRYLLAQQRRTYTVRMKMNELKHQALSANMNPHFIFNALNSVQHFINHDNALAANDFLTDFSRLIRMNMETTRQNLVSLHDELERLELYLKLEQSRFGDDLKYVIHCDPALEVHEVLLPPMLLQPFVENAIWHGIMPGGGKGHILIEAELLDDNQYRVTIEDDGIGYREGLNRRQSSHKSLSMDMNSERLKLLSQSTGKKFELKISDLSEMESGLHGTRVVLTLPANFTEW